MGSGIVFICGSLEPGRDGVGDYTRRLAAVLQRAGNRVHLIAVYDKHIRRAQAEVQVDGPTSVTTLRIPYNTALSGRLDQLQEEVDAFDPAWISLQYVPHAFNKYGLPLGLLYTLHKLRSTAAWHIMFHELWITPASALDLKQQFIAALEHRAVSWLIGKGLHPRVIHTHLPAYGRRLLAKGASVSPLPLFANIDRHPTDHPLRTPGTFRAVFFSQLSAPPPVIGFLRQLRQDLTQRGEQLEIHLLGGGPQKVARAAAELTAELPGLRVLTPGFLPADEVSRHLAQADLGITPVLHHEIGKSGTVAAFLTHRLPVAAPLMSERTPSFFPPELNAAVLITYSEADLRRATAAAAALDTSLISATRIAATLAADLTAAYPDRPIRSGTAPATLTP